MTLDWWLNVAGTGVAGIGVRLFIHIFCSSILTRWALPTMASLCRRWRSRQAHTSYNGRANKLITPGDRRSKSEQLDAPGSPVA